MNPYAPPFSHTVDLAVAWAAVAAWLIIAAGALRRRFAAVTSRAEQVCSAAALAFLAFAVAIMVLFEEGAGSDMAIP